MNKKDPRTHAIIGASMEVHRILGPGFLEPVYHEALKLELPNYKVTFAHEVEIPIIYKGIQLPAKYRADFLCFDSIIVEIKALDQLSGVEEAQLLNYLKATGKEVGLLINFGASSLEYQRYTNFKWSSQSILHS